MANTKSAKKAAKQNEIRRLRNAARLTAIKTAIKKVRLAVEQKQDGVVIQNLLADVNAKLSRAKSKGVVHPNAASRKMSRLVHYATKEMAA